MFQFVPKTGSEEPSAQGVFRCSEPAARSRAVWLIPVIFSAVWMAVLAGIVIAVVLPELDADISAKTVAAAAALLWLLLCLCVRSSVRRTKTAVQLSRSGSTFSVALSNGKTLRYPADRITLRIHRMRSMGSTDPVKNGHFRLYITNGRKTDRCDIYAQDEQALLTWLSL